MRILLDTNIIIPLEDSSEILEESMSDFFGLASKNNHQLLIHPISIEDIEKEPNKKKRKIIISRVQKYQTLEDPPECDFCLEETSEEDKINNKILCAIFRDAVHFLVTEDRNIHKKAKGLGISDRVFYVQQALTFLSRLHNKKQIDLPNLFGISLHQLDINDPFFDSLCQDYKHFKKWFSKASKEGREAWILKTDNNQLAGICAYKEEKDPIINTNNTALPGDVLKISTFKVGDKVRGQKFGELLLKACFRYATENRKNNIYITVQKNRQLYLQDLLSNFGFVQDGEIKSKGESHMDAVFVKKHPITSPLNGYLPIEYHIKYFPHFIGDEGVAKFIVPIKPQYHEILFADNQQQSTLFPTSSAGNAIKLAYLCHAQMSDIRPGDVLMFYRSEDTRAITSIGIVEETMDSTIADHIAQLVNKRTVYEYKEIEQMAKKRTKVILFRLATHLDQNVKYDWLLSNGVVNGNIQTIRKINHESFKKIISTYKVKSCLLKRKKIKFKNSPTDILKKSLIYKRPEIALFSIKPEFAEKIITGSKKYEYRVGPIDREITHILIYATRPVGKIIGIGIVKNILKKSPLKIWELTKNAAGISRAGFRKYFEGKRVAYAIEIKKAIPLKENIQLSELGPNIKSPQSFSYVEPTLITKLIQKGLII